MSWVCALYHCCHYKDNVSCTRSVSGTYLRPTLNKTPYKMLLLCVVVALLSFLFCFVLFFPGVRFLNHESTQPTNHRHLLEMPWGTTGICPGQHLWHSACRGRTSLENRDNAGHLRYHRTLCTDNWDSPGQRKEGSKRGSVELGSCDVTP